MANLPLVLERLANRTLARSGQVLGVDSLAAGLRRIRIGSAGLRSLSFEPGLKIKLSVGQGAYRSYTLATLDPEQGAADLWIATCSGGPGSQWALSARPGDGVHFFGPEQALRYPKVAPGTRVLVVGDESAAGTLEGLATRGFANRLLVPRDGDKLTAEIVGDFDAVWAIGGPPLFEAVRAAQARSSQPEAPLFLLRYWK
jgi:NADPH-dependent ferric siderophore reductase